MDENKDQQTEAVQDKPIDRKASILRNIREFGITIVVSVCVALLLNVFVFQIIEVRKTSMVPTLNDMDRVFLNKTAYWFGSPQSGDIVVFARKNANGEKISYVKRVIGIPGDHIVINNGKVYRNGVELQEPYLDVVTNGNFECNVPEGKYYVLGDNRNVSLDSKNESFGLMDEDEVLGKVLFKLKPIGGIDDYDHHYSDKKSS